MKTFLNLVVSAVMLFFAVTVMDTAMTAGRIIGFFGWFSAFLPLVFVAAAIAELFATDEFKERHLPTLRLFKHSSGWLYAVIITLALHEMISRIRGIGGAS